MPTKARIVTTMQPQVITTSPTSAGSREPGEIECRDSEVSARPEAARDGGGTHRIPAQVSRLRTSARSSRLLPAPVLVSGGVMLGLSAAASAHILSSLRRLHVARQHAREVSESKAMTSPDAPPHTCFNHHGNDGDPINVEVIGTDAQIASAFAAAGWYRADEIALVTSARISLDSLLGLRYSTAPVSNLYLFGRKEDLAFERPGTSVRERDHIRLWNTGLKATDGRPIWVGGATRDIKVELAKTDHLPTHKIAPDVDAERDLVVSELRGTRLVAGEEWHPPVGTLVQATNGGGDTYIVDGRVAALTLADVPVSPLLTHARGPVAAGVVRALTRHLRPPLPEHRREPRDQPLAPHVAS